MSPKRSSGKRLVRRKTFEQKRGKSFGARIRASARRLLRGDLTKIEEYEYNEHGNLVEIVEKDENGRVVRTKQPGDPWVKCWSSQQLLKQLLMENQRKSSDDIEYEYDKDGRVVKKTMYAIQPIAPLTVPLDNGYNEQIPRTRDVHWWWEYEYDERGNLVRKKEKYYRKEIRRYGLDARSPGYYCGKKEHTVSITEYEYDDQDNIVKKIVKNERGDIEHVSEFKLTYRR